MHRYTRAFSSARLRTSASQLLLTWIVVKRCTTHLPVSAPLYRNKIRFSLTTGNRCSFPPRVSFFPLSCIFPKQTSSLLLRASKILATVQQRKAEEKNLDQPARARQRGSEGGRGGEEGARRRRWSINFHGESEGLMRWRTLHGCGIPAGLGWDWKLCQGRLRKRRMSQELLHAHVRTRARRSRFLADTRGHRQQLSTVETRVDIETTRSPKNKICTRSARVLLKSKLGTDSELLGVIAGNDGRSFNRAHTHGLFRNEPFNIVGSIFD